MSCRRGWFQLLKDKNRCMDEENERLVSTLNNYKSGRKQLEEQSKDKKRSVTAVLCEYFRVWNKAIKLRTEKDLFKRSVEELLANGICGKARRNMGLKSKTVYCTLKSVEVNFAELFMQVLRVIYTR